MTDAAPRPASPLDALKPLAGRALEALLARLLALDPETREGLAGLDGRRVRLALAAPPLALEVRVDGEALRVGPAGGDEPDLAVRGTLGGLLSQLPFLRPAGAGAPVGQLTMSGDVELARRLQRLAEGYDPDMAKPFADLLGPVLGPQVAAALAAALRGGRAAAGRFARDAADYLVEERRDVVGADELAAFHDDVDAVRDGVERAEARLKRLRERAAGGGA